MLEMLMVITTAIAPAIAPAIAIPLTLFKSLVEGTLNVVLYKIRTEHDDVILNSAPLKKR